MEDLKALLKSEVAWYASGGGLNNRAFFTYNDQDQVYAALIVDHPTRHNAAGVMILARIEGDNIVIEEDSTDRPLYRTLMEMGIPRERIICTYAG